MNSRLENLLNRWLDGELDAPEAAAVQRMLIDDPAARKAYYELLLVDQMLDEQVEGRASSHGSYDVLAGNLAQGSRRRRLLVGYLAVAALVVLSLSAVFFLTRKGPAFPAPAGWSGPLVSGSMDSRMTIAQRDDTAEWAVGEILRLERGTAAIRLNRAAAANFEGPAAVELLDAAGNIRLLEGMASFQVHAAGNSFEVHVPGGILRDKDSRFTTQVLSEGIANVRVESGLLEIHPRGFAEPLFLRSGEALRLEHDGSTTPIRLPDQHFRSGLPQPVVLFRDNFQDDEGRALEQHQPQVGQSWQVPFAGDRPTILHKHSIDTTGSPRRLLARLAPHQATGSRAVYVFTFQLLPPANLANKIWDQGGVEFITLVDGAGKPCLSLLARAIDGHRWQLHDESSQAVPALTPVCALWAHSLTLCYGLDGRVTLHDGATAQAPIITELRVTAATPLAGILIGNHDGGDLAFAGIEATLLPALPTDAK